MAPLLPKLRGQFAEFLNNPSPVGLRILSSPTCVGLRYGHLRISIAAFLASVNSSTSLLNFGPHQHSALRERTSLLSSLTLPGSTNARLDAILLCHCLLKHLSVVRNFNRCPSATPFGLALAPDLPWADEPSPGNLRLSTPYDSHIILATHSGILSCIQSTAAYAHASPRIQRSSTTVLISTHPKLR